MRLLSIEAFYLAVVMFLGTLWTAQMAFHFHWPRERRVYTANEWREIVPHQVE